MILLKLIIKKLARFARSRKAHRTCYPARVYLPLVPRGRQTGPRTSHLPNAPLHLSCIAVAHLRLSLPTASLRVPRRCLSEGTGQTPTRPPAHTGITISSLIPTAQPTPPGARLSSLRFGFRFFDAPCGVVSSLLARSLKL